MSITTTLSACILRTTMLIYQSIIVVTSIVLLATLIHIALLLHIIKLSIRGSNRLETVHRSCNRIQIHALDVYVVEIISMAGSYSYTCCTCEKALTVTVCLMLKMIAILRLLLFLVWICCMMLTGVAFIYGSSCVVLSIWDSKMVIVHMWCWWLMRWTDELVIQMNSRSGVVVADVLGINASSNIVNRSEEHLRSSRALYAGSCCRCWITTG